MKKPILTFLSFILVSVQAFAGSTSLTTYYPPPVGAYNQVKLSTSATAVTCNGSNNGTLYADSSGTLHVCMNGTSVIYPQACYNSFCTSSSSVACSCAPSPICQPNFHQVSVSANPGGCDIFQTSASSYVNSYVCCSS